MAEIKLNKVAFIPYLDISDTVSGLETWTPTWKRVDRSSVFALNFNAQTNTMDYICNETPITEVDHYEPNMEQEIAVYEGNPIYDFLLSKYKGLPVGNDCYVPALLRLGSDNHAWQIKETTLVIKELNAVDNKLTFTLNFGGDIQKGTINYTGGVPSFTEDSASD